MATASSPKPASSSSEPKTDSKSGDARVVPFSDGQEHGYVGAVHPEKNRDDYTVTGDEPALKSVEDRAGWAPLQKF